MKQMFEDRFKKLYPDKRLLAIQLNGFSHVAFYDSGTEDSRIETYNYSAYIDGKCELFDNIPHSSYKQEPVEIVYIRPEER